ncbi:leukotriene B4 receptor 1-like [Pseudoliparis swirei]|uniref:leukotriene B4 receptor 1-like n=1 Tax=Pseudoliparis swirei TaxID=2059687 RepID=UPI0024BE9CBE|nr:leukotriene B4 receptor 1-like [Pseudoliparis swirei]
MNRSTELPSPSPSPSPSDQMAPEEFDGGTAVACVILGLSFLVGAPGNLLVIWTILRHVKQRSHTVMLILHLAVADLLVLVTLPLWIYSLARAWLLGEALCKALVYIVSVCMFGSIFFITLMSVERYFAICHPFAMMRWRRESAMNGCLVLLWAFALLLGAPSLLTGPLDGRDGSEQCFVFEFTSETRAIAMLCLETSCGFVVPFIILGICYSRVAAQLRKMSFESKPKSTLLVHAVVIAFALCWSPYHVVNAIDLVCILGSGAERECVPESVVFGSGALAFISSSVNPVLYALFARNLQESLERSRLVRLFQEMAAHTNTLRDVVVRQQTGQRAADSQTELMSDRGGKVTVPTGTCDVSPL